MKQINLNVAGSPTDIPYILVDSGNEYPGYFELENSRCVIMVSGTETGGFTLNWSDKHVRGILPFDQGAFEGGLLDPPLPTLIYDQAFPTPPTRDQVCGIQLTFQGLTVNTSVSSNTPWFGAALAWFNEADRKASYAAQHANGDTHCIIELPDGKPVYDEPNQFYSPDRFGPLDLCNNFTYVDDKFIDLVVEVIKNNFIPMIFLDEVYDNSIRLLPLLLTRLQNNQYGVDLTQYCLILPGWDSVFYGWEPSNTLIPNWARLARSISPNCYLGIEHDTGHIPVGNGENDYAPNNLMKDYDVILSEYGGAPFEHNDAFWQVAARMVRPYNRPSDQPSGDDPNPPFYLAHPSARGKFFYCGFEFGYDMYLWVRNAISSAEIEQHRQYIRNAGVLFTG